MTIDGSVLVLNKLFQPVHITTVRRVFCLLAKGYVKVVDEQVRTYDFAEWLLEEPGEEESFVATPNRRLRVPRMVHLVYFDRLPRREVKFSRRNVYLRDESRCQYCGKIFPLSNLNLDHVVPISRGGTSSWENVVSSCFSCNTRKRDRLPEEAGLQLLRKPDRPRWHSFMGLSLRGRMHDSWKTFLVIPARMAEQ